MAKIDDEFREHLKKYAMAKLNLQNPDDAMLDDLDYMLEDVFGMIEFAILDFD